MIIPQRLTLTDIQQAFRQVQRILEELTTINVNMDGRRVINAGKSVSNNDYVTKAELDAVSAKTDQPDPAAQGLLNFPTIKVQDEAYSATTWDGSLEVPTKNAVRDKIQSLLGSTAYTPTNVTPDRSYDANATTTDELADVLGTLVADLQSKGILS